MELKKKREEALKLLASTGMKRANYEPPLMLLLWRLGFDVAPPHFNSFGKNVLSMGVWCVICFGLIGWLLRLDSAGAVFVKASFAGLILGIISAGYFAWGKHKHKIPSWKEFGQSYKSS